MVGAALTVTVLAVPAVNTTGVLDVNPPALPLTVAVSNCAPAVSVVCAVPLASVTAVPGDTEPADVAKVTVIPCIGLPAVSSTVARMMLVPVVTGMLPVLAVVLMEPTVTLLLLTVMLAGVPGVLPLLVIAVMVSVPAPAPAV